MACTKWDVFLESLPQLPPYQVLSRADLNSRALQFTDYLKLAFDKACPPKKVFPGKICRWWTPSLTNLLRKKNLAAREQRRYFGTMKGVRAKLRKIGLGKLFKKVLKSAKRESWQTFTTGLTDTSTISKLFKSLKAK